MRGLEERGAHSTPAPRGKHEGADLRDVRHGGEDCRVQLQTLTANDGSRILDRHVERLAPGKRLEITALLVSCPCAVDRRMHTFSDHGAHHTSDSRRVVGDRPSNLKAPWHPSIVKR